MKETFSYEKLYKAYLDCRKNKRNTDSALEFEWDMEKNLYELYKEINSKTYNPGKSICFVCEEPTVREIFAAEFRDRIIYHLLVNEVEEAGERNFIYDSYSCRKNKGTHKAVKRLKSFSKKVTKNYSRSAYCLQMDISGFFMSINHKVLYAIFKKIIVRQEKPHRWKSDLLWLGKKVIYHKPIDNYQKKGNTELFKLVPPRKSLFFADKNKGLPIGNYCSQFFSNLYLNQLDQFVKRKLKRKYYIRYVDDFLILGTSKKSLKNDSLKIENFLKNYLDLKINTSKTKLKDLRSGIDFLGYFLKPGYKLARERTVKSLKSKLYEFRSQPNPNPEEVMATINSYFGHFKHANSFKLRKNIYEKHLGKLKKHFKTDARYFSVQIKSRPPASTGEVYFI